MKKSYIIILLVILIGISLFNVLAGFFTGGGREEVVISNEQFTHIEIDINNADIKLLVADSRPFVELVNRGKYHLNVNVKGNTLDIKVDDPWFDWFSFDFSFKTPKLNVYLPQEMYETVIVNTKNGTIDVENINVIELNSTTKNGKIIVKDVESSAIYSESKNGEIIMENITGSIIGLTKNGNVIIKKDKIDLPIDIETKNGNITILTKNEPDNVIYQFRTRNGNIKVFGSEDFNIVIGNGTNLVKLETDNGNIDVKKQ